MHMARIEGFLDGDDGEILAELRAEVSKVFVVISRPGASISPTAYQVPRLNSPGSTLNPEAAMSIPILDLSL